MASTGDRPKRATALKVKSFLQQLAEQERSASEQEEFEDSQKMASNPYYNNPRIHVGHSSEEDSADDSEFRFLNHPVSTSRYVKKVAAKVRKQQQLQKRRKPIQRIQGLYDSASESEPGNILEYYPQMRFREFYRSGASEHTMEMVSANTEYFSAKLILTSSKVLTVTQIKFENKECSSFHVRSAAFALADAGEILLKETMADQIDRVEIRPPVDYPNIMAVLEAPKWHKELLVSTGEISPADCEGCMIDPVTTVPVVLVRTRDQISPVDVQL